MRLRSSALIDHPRLLAVGILTLTAVAFAGMTSLRFDDDYRGVFRSDGPDFVLFEETAASFGSEENQLLVILQAADILDPASLRLALELDLELREQDTIEEIDSAFSASALPGLLAEATTDEARRELRGAIREHPLLMGHLISGDGTTMLLVAHLDLGIDTVPEIRAAIQPIGNLLERVTSGTPVETYVTGLPAMRHEIVGTIQRDQLRFSAVGLGLTSLIALLIFRSLSALVIVGVGPAIGVIWTMGLLGWVGEPLNVLNNVVPTLVLVIGFTDSVHLLHRFRGARSAGRSRRQASIDAVKSAGAACALTSLTTAIGFASLTVAPLDIVRRFGLACAAGALLSFAAVITVLPLLANTRLGDLASRRRDTRNTAGTRLVGAMDPILRRPRLFATLGVVLLIVALVATSRLEADYRYREFLSDRSEVHDGLRVLDRQFGGAAAIQAVVTWSDPAAPDSPELATILAEVEDSFDREAATTAPMSILTFAATVVDWTDGPGALSEVPAIPSRVADRWYRPDLRTAVVRANIPGIGASEMNPLLDSLSQRFSQVAADHPGFEIALSGLRVVTSRSSVRMIETLARSLGLAAIFIFVIIAVAFRSLRIGLVSIVPNVLPLAAIGAFLALSGRPLQFTSVTVFSVCLGIAVDDTIHLLVALRRERHRGGTALERVRRAVATVGPALVITTALLIVSFGAIFLSEMPLLRLFAVLCCSTFAIALVADLIFLPALLVAFGVDPPGATRTGGSSTAAPDRLPKADSTEPARPAAC